MFDRIAPVYDAMNRAITLGLDRRRVGSRRRAWYAAGRSRARRGLRNRRPRARRPRSGRHGHGPRLLRAELSARGGSPTRSSGCGGDVLALPCSRTPPSTPRRSASGSVTSTTFARASSHASFGLAAGSPFWSSRGRPACCARSSASGSTRPHPARGEGAARGRRLLLPLRRASGAFPGPADLVAALRRAGFEDADYRLLAAGIVSAHVGRR